MRVQLFLDLMRRLVLGRLALLSLIIFWLPMLTIDSKALFKSMEASQGAVNRDYYFLNESKPFTEYYAGADKVAFIEHLNQDEIIQRCLLHDGNQHVQTIEDLDTAAINLDSIGDVFWKGNGTFSVFALKVFKDDQDMIASVVLPGLYGSNLRKHLAAQGMARYCRENFTSPLPPWLASRDEVRVPVMVCTRSATINRFGFIRKDSFQINSFTRFKLSPDKDRHVQIVSDPVFSIAQFRGEAIYHHIIEGMSRLAPCYDQLIQNPRIKIHLNINKYVSFMEFLGFPRSRIVSTRILANSIVMFPEPHQSGSRRFYTLKKLRRILTLRLSHYFSDLERDKHVIVIRRSGTRSVVNFDVMLRALKARFPQENFVVYRDDPVPSVQHSFRMFYEAKMVIGPHGAGLSNTLLCKPGTPVIEFLTDERRLNACFVGISSYLGLQHEAFAPPGSSHTGSFNVNIETLLEIMSKHL